MKISSPAFDSGETIPLEYTCDGDDINPPLSIDEVPPDSGSLVMIMDDPDAPTGTFTHWLVWNIHPATEEIEEGVTPSGAEVGVNSTGIRSYSGPCPPTGQHRYFFRLYALDSELDISASSEREDIEEAMSSHIIARSELMGTYGREEEGEFAPEEEV